MKPARARVLGFTGLIAAAALAGAVAVHALSPGETRPVAPTNRAGAGASVSASAVGAGGGGDAAPTAAGPTNLPEPPGAPEQAPPARCAPEPKLEVPAVKLPPAEEIVRLVKEDPRALGSASIGSPTQGSLWGGVEMKASEGILRAGAHGWGTGSVVRSIERAVREVRRCFPGSPSLYVGDIARERGGWLRPHRSHQSGLDADIGYYYRIETLWYVRATAENLDAPRLWALVRALIEGGNVDMIFMDLSIQRLLQAHIEALPESERSPADLFESPTRKDAIIRHAWGHATHFHVRFKDPAAVELGQRLKGLLPGLPKPPRPKPVQRRVGPYGR